MSHILELHEFFVEGGDRKQSHVLLHITEPSSPAEMSKGYFFAVAEIAHGTTEHIEHLQDLIDLLEKKYYSDEDGENTFETAIAAVNRRGHYLLKDTGADISCIVGALSHNTLMFAGHGRPGIRLLYQGKEDVEEMNLFVPEEDTKATDQFFPALQQGTLNSGDYLCVTSPHVEEYISGDRIKKIITSRSTRQAASHLETILRDLNNGLSFGGLILHILKKHEMPRTGPVPKRLDEHVSDNTPVAAKEHGDVREKTEESETDPETNYRPRRASRNEALGSQILIIVGRMIVTGLLGLWRLIKKIGLLIGRTAVGLILLVTNKGGQRETVLRSLRQSIETHRQRFETLPLMSKLLFVLTCLLAVVFFGSIGYLRFQERQEQIAHAYTLKVSEIENTIEAAAASIIYNDSDKAMGLLQQARTLTRALPGDTDKEQTKIEEFNQTIEEKLLTLRKMVLVTPTVLLDLSSLGNAPQTGGLWRVENTLVAYGVEDPLLYTYDLTAKTGSTKNLQAIRDFRKHSTPKEQDGVFLLTEDQTLARYDQKTKTIAKQDITLANGQAAIADLFVYNQRLYTLDVGNNQIYRHNKTQTGFDKASPWIKQTTTNITKGVSLAIDGDIFVLTSDGNIFKFAAGTATPFAISGLDPALADPTIIWTYNEVNHLYILEPTNKRVIILGKDGKLLSQYTADVWQKPTGMVVDESKKTIYVLDSNKIYSFQYTF